MKYRNLRILFSVICVLACQALFALWVRSYLVIDDLSGPLPGNYSAEVFSERGNILFLYFPKSVYQWHYREAPLHNNEPQPYIDARNWIGFTWTRTSPIEAGILIPLWFPLVATAILAVSPWIRWQRRFSLRTLLITMTLAAVGLGVIVWAVR